MIPKVAAVTMVWNEPHFLPLWHRHYSRQVGETHCYVIDHGSNDGSTSLCTQGSIIRLPRTPLDEDKRSSFVSQFCNSLLESYDAVIYSDVDELLVSDPDIATDLRLFVLLTTLPVVTAVGLNVMWTPGVEAGIDPARIISTQRSSVWFAASMCKPMIIRRPVKWMAGFHNCDAEIRFGSIYNFHLRYYDMEQGLIRLRKTRSMDKVSPGLNSHHAISDEQWTNDLLYNDSEPRLDNASLKLEDAPLCDYISRIEDEQHERKTGPYKIDLELWEKRRWKLPPRFVGTF